VASVNGYFLPPLDDLLSAEIGDAYRSAIAPGAIIPYLFIMMMHMLMFDGFICDLSMLVCVYLLAVFCLFICVICFHLLYPPHPRCQSTSLSMSKSTSELPVSTTSPLMTMVLTCKALYLLVIMMPNLQNQLWWMESDLTVLLNPLNPLGQPLLAPLNSDWEAMVVISSPHLAQNLVLNITFLNLQGSF